MEYKLLAADAVRPYRETETSYGNSRFHGTTTFGGGLSLSPSVHVKVNGFPGMKASLVNPATIELSSLAGLFQFNSAVPMSVGSGIEMPNGWVVGTPVTPFIQLHKSKVDPGTVQFTLESKLVSDDLPTILTYTQVMVIDTATLPYAQLHTYTFPPLVTTGMSERCVMGYKLTRNGNADTYPGEVIISGSGVIVQVDSILRDVVY